MKVEIEKQIEVETGISIDDHESKKSYKLAVNKVLDQLKKELPPSLYKERATIVNNAWRSLNKAQVSGRYGVGGPGNAPLTEYFNLKKDTSESKEILKGMFKDSEIYDIWVKENE